MTMPEHEKAREPCLPRQPGTLEIFLLNQCNLSCRHCFMDAVSHTGRVLPLDLVFRSLGEMDHLGIGSVYFTGGEPFLYPHLPELLRYISQKTDYGITLATNGTLIDRSAIDLLDKSRIKVNVSIDGPPEYHDRFRGAEGAFLRSSRGIGLLMDAGVSVSIVTTVCRDNLAHLPWLAEWAAENGIRNVIIQPLFQLGRGQKIREKRLSQSQIRTLFFQLSDLGCAYQSRGVNFAVAYKNRDFLLEHPCAAYVCKGSGCHRRAQKEIKKLIIREDGTILPEIETIHPRFSLGNVRDGLLVDFVRRYFESGYADFDHLCRSTFAEILPSWVSPLIPWDEIVSEASWNRDFQMPENLIQTPA
jgi:Fe-coproporphyrin III synthase